MRTVCVRRESKLLVLSVSYCCQVSSCYKLCAYLLCLHTIFQIENFITLWEKTVGKGVVEGLKQHTPSFSLQPNMYGCFTNHTFFLLYHPFSQRFLLYHPPKPHYPHIKLFPFQLPYLPSNLFSFQLCVLFQLCGGSKNQSHHRGTVAEENIFTAAPSIFLGVRWNGSGGSGVP